jgi:hypothetical protein
MVAAGIGLIVLGYALLYSGVSQIISGDKGWGVIKSLTGKGVAGGTKSTAIDTLFGNITPQGNSGASAPSTGTPPVSGVTPV